MGSKRRYFGTDGIRGMANTEPMTAETALKLGMAAGHYFRRQSENTRHRTVIAKDTRLSGYLLEPAITAGLIAAGMDVILVGPLPTPAVAMLTRSMRADLGIMISASHNPYRDNGIKLFAPDGYKLSDAIEAELEALMDGDPAILRAKPEKLGKARRLENARGRYIEFAKQSFPRELSLKGLRIVLDCAHGAAYYVAPTVLWELGAEVIAIGTDPDGTNINDGVGSTAPQAMQQRVVAEGASLGIALDGDADRLVMCDEKGELLDGDQLMALVARQMQKRGTLTGGGMVATVMSNLGLERFIHGLGLTLHRTAVGDRYVMEAMREKGINLGGEQSGHIILSDYATTGDGLVAALQVLSVLAEEAAPASAALRCFTPLPQELRNLRYDKSKGTPLKTEAGKRAVQEAEARLGERGRIVVRASGTEPLIRLMGEAEEEGLLGAAMDALEADMQRVIGG